MSKSDFFKQNKRPQARGKIAGLGNVVFRALNGQDYIDYATLTSAGAPVLEVARLVVERGVHQKGKRVFADGELAAKGADLDEVQLINWHNKILLLSGSEDAPGKP